MSFKDSVMTMVPFTEANKEAKKAFRNFGDITALEAEKQRVCAIEDLIRDGEHNAALQELLMDTNTDLHYFNKIKNNLAEKRRKSKRHEMNNEYWQVKPGRTPERIKRVRAS
eukprot:13331029-Ditylum_brightwellii.AAC.1